MPADLTDPPPPAEPPRLELDYGQAPHPLRRKRVRWAIWTGVAAAILALTYFGLAPLINDRWELLDFQRRWRTLSRIEGQHAYFETWQVTKDSSSRARGSSQESAHDKLRELYALPKSNGTQATVFLHARRAPGGGERLVVVEFDPGRAQHPVGANVTLTLDWYTGTPAGWLTSPSNLNSGSIDLIRPPIPGKGETTFFVGQPDLKDPAHFTLPYQVDGQKGEIDGRLRPDGKLDLIVTSGPLRQR